ncbi:Proton-coupled folate transporter [Aphelenchoides fujianensis]|nr:Proton-coupled folate transporter [Aphelenchoides fujianensis]
MVILCFLYYFFEQHDFILAVEVFRPALIFVGIANLSGILCALVGVLMEREVLVSVQSALLTGLVVISDLIALGLVLTMAIGTRSKFTQRLPGYLVDAERFESVLGPFWIYLCAILFHMLAASITENKAESPNDPPDARAEGAWWRTALKHNLTLFWMAIRAMNAEFVVFLVYLGWAYGNTLQAPGLYRRICETYYETESANCSKIGDPQIERAVEQHTADWSLYNALAYLGSAMLADTILGSFGDKYGRQIPILFSLTGIALSEYGFLLTLSETVHAPYFITPIFGIFAGLTGYIAIFPSPDVTDNTELLTIRAGVLSASQSLATVIGGVAAAFSSVQIGIAVDVELALYLLAFVYTIIRIPQVAGHRSEASASPPSSQLQVPRSNTLVTNTSSRSGTFKEFFRELFALLKSGLRVYTRPRVGHRRAFMIYAMLVLMVCYTAFVETRISPVLNSYVFRRSHGGLDWSTYELGLWNGIGYLIVFLGTLVFLPIFKRILKLRETTIIMIGIVSSAARLAIMGFSTKTWHMYVAQLAGIFSGVVQPATVSFVVQLVPYEEIGRAFSLFGIGADLAFIITNRVQALSTVSNRVEQPPRSVRLHEKRQSLFYYDENDE